MPRKVDKVKSCRKVSISIKNGRRWVSLKNHLGFPTDDELADYLLNLADSVTIDRESKSFHENTELCKEERIHENDGQSNFKKMYSHGRTTRKVNLPDASKGPFSEKSKGLSNSLHSYLGITKTKRHVNKSKCHRDKHKKKQQKIKDANVLATTRNKIMQKPSKSPDVFNKSAIEKESKENDTVGLSLSENLDVQYELKPITSRINSRKKRELLDSLQPPEMNKTLELDLLKTSKNFIENANVSSCEGLNNSCENAQEESNKLVFLEEPHQVDVTLSIHDESSNQEESKDNVTEIDVSKSPLKQVCTNCNGRHLQDACTAATKPEYVIEDSISLLNWINKHKSNSKVAKAVDSTDPMSHGYSDGTNSLSQDNEETVKHYKAKCNIQCEEKQDNVHPNWPLYSRESVPYCLELKMSNMDHGLGVFTKSHLPMHTQFGPLVGQLVQEMDIPDDYSMRHIWEILVNDKTQYISTTNPLKSNWIRYIRPSETEDSRNVDIVKKNGQLYLATCKTLVAGTELIYWLDSYSNSWTRKNKMDKMNCGGCNIKFSHPIYYRLHCCIFHDINYSLTIRKYHCKVCGAAILGKDNIMKHAAQFHAGRGAYQCQYCKKFFLRLNYLEMHRTYGCSKNPQRSRPLCDFCGRKFCQPQKLKVHIKRMHSDASEVLEEFQCKQCFKLLGSRAALARHLKEVHHKDVVGAAACDRCGKTFQNKSNLKIHMLTHSGVKPFKCLEKECKAAFTTKQCLQFHYKKVHGLSDEKMPKIERSIAYTFDAYSGGQDSVGQSSRVGKFSFDEKEECNKSFELEDDEDGDDTDKSQDTVISKTLRGLGNEKAAKDLKPNSPGTCRQMETAEPSAESAQANLDICEQECTTQEMDEVAEKLTNGRLEEPTLLLSTETFNMNDIPSNVRESDNEASLAQHQMSAASDEKLDLCKRQESYNASLLVEAALDAAERDIGVVSISTCQQDNEQVADLYAAPSELGFKPSDYQQVAHEPASGRSVDSFVHDELQVMSSASIPNSRQALPISVQYRAAPGYLGTPSRLQGIEQYLEQEILTSSRYDEVGHFHSNANFQIQSHRSTVADPAPVSSDESDSAVQNLSLSVKDRNIQEQLEAPKFDYEPDYNSASKARVKFEPLLVQSAREQGLDMSARGFQQVPAAAAAAAETQMQNSTHLYHQHHHHHHHHHNPYKMHENERHGVDLSTSAPCVSPSYATIYSSYPHVDVSRVMSLEPTLRSHQLHTAVSRIIASPLPETLVTSLSSDAEVRVLPCAASPVSAYNTSSYPATSSGYHTARSGYHYCNYY